MLKYIKENKQLKKELKDMRHKYDDLKEDKLDLEKVLEIKENNNLRLLRVNSILVDMINEIEKETWINQLGSDINLQNKLIKILDDGKSKLVSISK